MRTLGLAMAALAAVTSRTSAEEQEVTVPPRIQAQLLAAVASIQTNAHFAPDGAVQILVLVKDKDADSERIASQLPAALGERRKIMRRPHRELTEPFRGGAALAAACRQRG